jgi:hypothetical protein
MRVAVLQGLLASAELVVLVVALGKIVNEIKA